MNARVIKHKASHRNLPPHSFSTASPCRSHPLLIFPVRPKRKSQKIKPRKLIETLKQRDKSKNIQLVDTTKPLTRQFHTTQNITRNYSEHYAAENRFTIQSVCFVIKSREIEQQRKIKEEIRFIENSQPFKSTVSGMISFLYFNLQSDTVILTCCKPTVQLHQLLGR